MKTLTKYILLTILIASNAFAQIDSLWSHTFGGIEWDVCKSVHQTIDQGYIMAGYTRSFTNGMNDFWLVKTDSSGNLLWSKNFGGDTSDECNSVQVTNDGGYILAGTTWSFGAGCGDFWLIKTDENGDTLWSRTYGRLYTEDCNSVQQTLDNGYILGGNTGADVLLVKTDSVGDTLWTKTFGGRRDDMCSAVLQTMDGGYIIGGYTESFGAEYSDFWLVKTDSVGDSLWSRTFGGEHSDYCYDICETDDGGYLLGGTTYSFGNNSQNSWLLRTDANGDSLWSKTMNGLDVDICFSVKQTVDEGFITGGYIQSYGSGGNDFWLIKIDQDGDSVWSKTFGGTYHDVCYSVEQTLDEGYIMGGFTQSFGAGDKDFWLVKTDAEGNLVWNNGVIAPVSFYSLSSYPNPFNQHTVLSFEMRDASFVNLTIYDITGREVAKLVDGIKPAGSHQVVFDAEGLTSGVYFARLEVGDFSQTRKILLIK